MLFNGLSWFKMVQNCESGRLLASLSVYFRALPDLFTGSFHVLNPGLLGLIIEVKPPGRFQNICSSWQVQQELKRNLLSQGLELKLRDITVEGVLKEKAVMLHRLCLGKWQIMADDGGMFWWKHHDLTWYSCEVWFEVKSKKCHCMSLCTQHAAWIWNESEWQWQVTKISGTSGPPTRES